MYATTKIENSAVSVPIRQTIPTRPRSRFRTSSCSLSGMLAACAMGMIPLFVFPVRIFRMFQVPQRTAAADFRQRRVVVFGGRRGGSPLQRPGIPRIVTGFAAATNGGDHVPDEYRNRETLEREADCGKEIPFLPAAGGGVRVNTRRHAQNADEMHRIEGDMET